MTEVFFDTIFCIDNCEYVKAYKFRFWTFPRQKVEKIDSPCKFLTKIYKASRFLPLFSPWSGLKTNVNHSATEASTSFFAYHSSVGSAAKSRSATSQGSPKNFLTNTFWRKNSFIWKFEFFRNQFRYMN